MPTDRAFRARILAVAHLAESLFDLAPFVEQADLAKPLERLGARVGALLSDAAEAADVAGEFERSALEDIEDEHARLLAAVPGACGGRQ
jgi:hypothetical protein